MAVSRPPWPITNQIAAESRKHPRFPRTPKSRDEYNQEEQKTAVFVPSQSGRVGPEQKTGFRNEGGHMPIVETEVEKPAAQGAAMEISVSRQDLLKELTATQSVVARQTTIPILSNFLLEADGENLTITATDLDQAIRTSASVKVKKPGACTIPARKLYDYIKLLPEGDISIKLLENHWVQIRSGRSN